MAFCGEMWREPTKGRMLVLAGENGSGKTHCAKAVRNWVQAVGYGNQFIERENHISHLDCLFWHWPGLLDTFKGGGWDVVRDMMETHCLILDELGGGHDPSRVGVDKLCQVLSRREQMWTLVTTNFLPDAWEQAFDRRVSSRLMRNSTLIDLSDVPDFSTI